MGLGFTNKEVREIYDEYSIILYGKKYSKLNDKQANHVRNHVVDEINKNTGYKKDKEEIGLGLFKRFG